MFVETCLSIIPPRSQANRSLLAANRQLSVSFLPFQSGAWPPAHTRHHRRPLSPTRGALHGALFCPRCNLWCHTRRRPMVESAANGRGTPEEGHRGACVPRDNGVKRYGINSPRLAALGRVWPRYRGGISEVSPTGFEPVTFGSGSRSPDRISIDAIGTCAIALIPRCPVWCPPRPGCPHARHRFTRRRLRAPERLSAAAELSGQEEKTHQGPKFP